MEKANYLIKAEQAHERKLNRVKEVIERPEFDTYMENRTKKGYPDAPREELYKKFLKTQSEKRLREKIKKIYG